MALDQLKKETRCTNCGSTVSFNLQKFGFKQCQCGWNIANSDALNAINGNNHNDKANAPARLGIGFKGVYDAVKFTVLGRITLQFNDFYYNIWTLSFVNGKTLLLQESNDEYSILEQIEEDPTYLSNALKKRDVYDFFLIKSVGTVIQYSNRKVYNLSYEGEFAGNDTYLDYHFEFQSERGDDIFVLLNYKHIGPQIFSTKNLTISDLNFEQSLLTPQVEERINCLKCNELIVLVAGTYSYACVCPKCKTILGKNTENKWKINAPGTSGKNYEHVFTLPLYTKIDLDDTTFEIIGAISKYNQRDKTEQWREYTLFSKETGGFIFFSEFDDHWTILRVINEVPIYNKNQKSSFTYKGDKFKLYHNYVPINNYCVGEFNFDLKLKISNYAHDFIAPPYLLNLEIEVENNNRTWFEGEYMPVSYLRKLVRGTDINIPKSKGVGAIELPSKYKKKDLMMLLLVSLLLLLGTHLVMKTTDFKRVIYKESFLINSTDSVVQQSTKPFVLKANKSYLDFDVFATVNNSWVSVNIDLTNEETGAEYNVYTDVSYYHGVDGGESWSEGSKKASKRIYGLPKGTYVLNIATIPNPEVTSGEQNEVSIKVVNEKIPSSNLLFYAFILLIWPIGHIIVSYVYDSIRWQN